MAGFFSLPAWALQFAQRALHAWVRTTVFPENPRDVAIAPDKPVCYVLQDEHLSNQLVLFEELERRHLPAANTRLKLPGIKSANAFFCLTRRRAFGAHARERYAHPALMSELVRGALSQADFDVQIVPVTILWGRRPDKQESILKALFADTWQQVGFIGRLFTILLHGRNVLVRFSPPISLRSLAGENAPPAHLALRKLSRVLRVHFRRQREMAIGPDLSHRNTQIDNLLAASSVRTAIANESALNKIPEKEAQARARRFALEIASDYSYGTLRAVDLLLSWLWNRLYDGIEIYNVDAVTRLAPTQGIVYVPAHRSHIDYLVLSYFLHKKGLTPPHIAAGANLNMPLVGPILRRCGAFFLRRSFKGEPLYAAVFHEYLHLMLTRGFPLEYFIEGWRSRSGRTLSPKAGILGMTISSYIREHQRPLVFIPVYLGYEKLLEGNTYLRELAGKPKQKESLWGVLQSIRKIRKEYGRVHINFGEPLNLSDFLAGVRPGWQEAPLGDWSREATRQAAIALATRLNDGAVVTPINLMALVLLAAPRHAIDEQMAERLLAHYLALSSGAPYSSTTVPCQQTPAQIIAYAEHLGNAQRVSHPLGDLIRIPDNDAPLLTYFRNNVLHLFALPALIACLISQNRRLHRQRMAEALESIYGLMQPELFLRWAKESLAPNVDRVLGVLVARGLVCIEDSNFLCAPGVHSRESAELRMLGETLRPSLERHFLTLSLLEQSGSGLKTRQQLENDAHLLAQRLALLYRTDSPEYSEKSVFSALIGRLIDADLLQEDKTGLLHFGETLTTPLAHTELVLPAETQQAIRRIASIT